MISRSSQQYIAPLPRLFCTGADLRLERAPALYVAGTPVTGRERRRVNGFSTGETSLIAGAVVVAVAVAGFFITRERFVGE